MPNKPSSIASDRHAYIPPQIQHALDQHMERNLPNHLKQYVGPNKPAYIPNEVRKSLAQQMQKNLPAHLNGYTSAYLEQRTVNPSISRASSSSVRNNPPPVPNQLRRDHSMPGGEQFTVELNSLPIPSKSMFSNENVPSPTLPIQAPIETVNSGPDSNHPVYDFILNPTEPPKPPLSLPSLPGVGPMFSKLLMVLIGLILLIIIYAVVQNVFKGTSNYPALLSVMQDQQELVHIVTNASQEPDISSTNKNFVATAELALNSSSNQLITYLKNNGHKVNATQLALKISSTTDKTLSSAEVAGTFNPSFDQVTTSLLNNYLIDLKLAYKLTSGRIGRGILNSDFSQAQKLLTAVSSNST